VDAGISSANIVDYFPFFVTHRAAYSKVIIQEVISATVTGVSFKDCELHVRQKSHSHWLEQDSHVRVLYPLLPPHPVPSTPPGAPNTRHHDPHPDPHPSPLPVAGQQCTLFSFPGFLTLKSSSSGESAPAPAPSTPKPDPFLLRGRPQWPGLVPSDNYLMEMFIRYCEKHKEFFRAQLEQIGGYRISGDTTYKCVKAVGKFDGKKKWVPIFAGLYLLVNEKLEIVDYGALEEDKVCFYAEILKRCKTRPNFLPSVFITDRCCHEAQTLRPILGPNCKIKLDLFHAIQRIGSCLIKKHPKFHECARTLSECFADRDKKTRVRLTPTFKKEKMARI